MKRSIVPVAPLKILAESSRPAQSSANRDARFLLIITASITPAIGAQVVRVDPTVRRNDYFETLQFWMRNCDQRLGRILFIENSGAGLDDLVREAARYPDKDIEFVSTPPLPLPAGMHYGFLELQMIDFALQRSRLWKESTHVIKVTGRLQFPDLSKLLNKLPSTFEFAVDTCQSLPFKLRQAFVPTQLFLTSKAFYEEQLRRSYHELKPDYPFYIEHLFYEKLTRLPLHPDRILRFPVSAEPRGHAGYSGKDYSRSKRLLLTGARSIMRRIAPWLWL